MKKLLVFSLSLALALTMLAGCSGGSDSAPSETAPIVSADPASETPASSAAGGIPQEKLDTTLYVGVSVRTLTNPYMVTIVEGGELFCKYLDSIGQKYEFQTLTNENSNEKQVNDLKAFIARADGNVICYVDPNEAAIASTIADLFEESKGYMVTCWNKPNDVNVADYDHWIAHHTPDDVQAGYDIAVGMFKNFETPYKGKILAIQGLLGNTTAVNRSAGLQKALEEYPDVELVEEQTANWDAQQALDLTETWLSKYTDIDGIWCANDNMATGVVQALKAKGLEGKVKLCGLNAIEAAVELIKEGSMTVTEDFNGWAQGGYSLALGYAAWTGQIDVPSLPAEQRNFQTESILVDKDTVADYESKYVTTKPVYDFTKPFDFIYNP